MSRFIYVVGSAPEMVKIGVATNAKHRISTLRTASGVPLSVAFVGQTDAAREIEARVHNHLSQSHLCGEWFAVAAAEAIEIILLYAKEIGAQIRLRPVEEFKARNPPGGLPIHIRFESDMLTGLDEWRKRQPDLPSRAEAMRRLFVTHPEIRRLVEQALSTAGKKR